MTREEFEHHIAPWLALQNCPGIGPLRANTLVRQFGSAGAVFAQTTNTLADVLGSERYAIALRQAMRPEQRFAHEAVFDWLHSPAPWPSHVPLEKALITQADARYPAQLKEIADPPLLLYALGASALLESNAPLWWQQCLGLLAVVGSRAPTPQGQHNALYFSAAVQQAGLCVVSGLAQGIDAAAHAGALTNAPQGCLATVAVMGTGIDRIYPHYHQDLAQRIANCGLLLTEYGLGVGPLAGNFPKRNRIITGLSQATLVVEATEKSGSLISARLAAEQGRDVMAIPGSIHALQSKGCHGLIKQGAQLVDQVGDILAEFGLPAPAVDGIANSLPTDIRSATVAKPARATQRTAQAPSALTRAASQTHHATPPAMPEQFKQSEHKHNSAATLLEAMGYDPVPLEQLQARTGLATAVLQAQLLELELTQQVQRMPGGYYQRIALA